MFLVNKVREISELTNYDWAAIIATFYGQTMEELNCDACKKIHKGDRGERLRERKGCWEAQTTPVFQYPTHKKPILKFYQCPGNVYDYGAQGIIELYFRYKEGMLPYPGTYQDQPNKVIEAFNLVEQLLEEKRLNGEQSRSRHSFKGKKGREGASRHR